MFINKDPEGKAYESFIDLAFEVCDEFMFVIRDDMPITDRITQITKDLSPYLTYSANQSEWPGTSYGGTAIMTVYFYSTTDGAKEIIKNISYSLHTWVQPKLPEDLCFIKNGESWLINTAHESCSHVKTKSKKEYMRLVNMGLDLTLDEDEKELFKVYDIKI